MSPDEISGASSKPPAHRNLGLSEAFAQLVSMGTPRFSHPLDQTDRTAARAVQRLPVIDSGRCIGGGWCGAACEPRVLSLEVVAWEKTSVLSQPERCTECSEYAVVCPFHTIRMHKLVDAGHTSVE